MTEGIKNTKLLHGAQQCPACKSELGVTLSDGRQGTRLIGVEYAYGSPERYDGISEYQCPDCSARFGRWSGRRLEDGDIEKRFGWSEEMQNAGI